MYELVENVNFTLIQVGLRWRKQQRLKIFGSMGSLVPPGQQNPSHHRGFSPKPWLSSWLPWWDVTMTAGWPPCFPGGFWISSLVATFVVESYWALQPSAPLLNRWKCILCFFCKKPLLHPRHHCFFANHRFSFFSARWGLWVLTFCCRCLRLLCCGLVIALSLSLLLCFFCSFHVC